MYSQSCWSNLCYPEVGAFTKGEMVREEIVYFPLLCLERSNTVFPHSLTHHSAGETKQEVACVGVSGKACPSLLMRFTWKCSVAHRASKRQTRAPWGSIHTWLRATCSCIFWFTECGRGSRAGLCNPTGRSLPWRWNVGTFLSLYYTAVMRQLLGENIGTAPREGRRRQSAPLHWALWDNGFAEAALSPSSGHQCLCTRWNFSKNTEEPPKCVLEQAIRGNEFESSKDEVKMYPHFWLLGRCASGKARVNRKKCGRERKVTFPTVRV